MILSPFVAVLFSGSLTFSSIMLPEKATDASANSIKGRGRTAAFYKLIKSSLPFAESIRFSFFIFKS